MNNNLALKKSHEEKKNCRIGKGNCRKLNVRNSFMKKYDVIFGVPLS
jgi:hypothetical protein